MSTQRGAGKTKGARIFRHEPERSSDETVNHGREIEGSMA